MYIVEVISQAFHDGQCVMLQMVHVRSYSSATRTDLIFSCTLLMCLSNCLALQQILP